MISLDDKDGTWLEILSAKIEATSKERQAFGAYLYWKYGATEDFQLDVKKKAFTKKTESVTETG